MKVWHWGILVIAISCLTLSRIDLGYGYDSDAAASAQAAESVAMTGRYVPSRLPGNPAFEYALVPFEHWGGCVATNGFILMCYCLSVAAVWTILGRRRHRELVTTLYALTPIVLVNAVTTMDYLPGLACLLWAYALASEKRWLWSGACLGLSIGCRITNVLFVVPLFLGFALRRRWREGLGAILIGLGIGALTFAPVFKDVGTRMLVIPDTILSPRMVALRGGYNAVMLLGVVPTVALVVILLFSGRQMLRALRLDLLRSTDAVVELVAIAMYVGFFLVHSDDAGYLIPVIPFLYLLLSRGVPRLGLIAFAWVVVTSSAITFEMKGGESGKRSITLRPTFGGVIADYGRRQAIERLRGDLARIVDGEPAIVLTGMGEVLTYRNDLLEQSSVVPLEVSGVMELHNVRKVKGQNVYFIYGMSMENVRHARELGYEIYMFSYSAPSVALNKYRYDPWRAGIRRIDVKIE